MKSLIWFSIVAGICAAVGCSSNHDTPDSQQLPTGFTFESTPGSFASIGWTGLLHDIEEPVGTPFGVKVDGDCKVDGQTGDTVCAFKGPVPPSGPVNRKRCAFRMSKTCTSDSDCPVDGGKPTPCVFMYDAPISVQLPSAPVGAGPPPIGACAWSYLPLLTADNNQTIDGQLNLTTGDLDLQDIDIELPLNYSPTGFYGACAECVGDPTPNDGVKGGVCKHTTHLGASAGITTGFADDGPDLGQPCDVNRFGTFPGFEGSYSMDCSPTVVSGYGIANKFGGTFKSGGFVVSITNKFPTSTDTSSMGVNTFCGMCGDDQTACQNDGECQGKGGSCIGASLPSNTMSPTNVPVAANACKTGVCNWNADIGLGSCQNKVTNQPTGCFPSGMGGVISAPGEARVDEHLSTIYYAKTGEAHCIPAVNAVQVQVNGQIGLPGLLFQKRNFKIIPEFTEGQ